MRDYKSAIILLESEEEVIINSIVNCVRRNDIRYLLPNAYKWLICCQGFHGFKNWDEFTEMYSDKMNLVNDLAKYQNRNQNDADPKAPRYKYFQQRESIYNSIMRILLRDEQRLADNLSVKFDWKMTKIINLD